MQVCWHAETNYGHPHLLPSRDNRVCWHAETNYGHPPPLPSRDNQVRWHAKTNYGHFFPFRRLHCLSTETITVSPLPSRDKRVRWHVETKHGHPHPFCYLETIKSDGTRRQIMVIHTLFAIQRQSSPMARRDKYGHLPFCQRLKCLSIETILVSLCYPETNRVQWNTKTNYGHLPLCRRLQCLSTETITISLCLLETSKSVGTHRQIMVIYPFVED